VTTTVRRGLGPLGRALLQLALVVSWVYPLGSAASAPSATTASAALGATLCHQVLPELWPSGRQAIKEVLTVMQAVRSGCLDQPRFLAVLGALLLEEGKGAQAAVWLERSLMLDPSNLGAQADLAMAMASSGDLSLLQALLKEWRDRSDVPPALRSRLEALLEGGYKKPFPAIRFGLPAPSASWATQGEISLMAGRETNLDRAPSLTELTLTIPDGPIVLPVDGRPRRGGARVGALSYQVAYVPNESLAVRAGFGALARQSPENTETDWRQNHAQVSAHLQSAPWRATAELGFAWVNGRLGEPYRQKRKAWGIERVIDACQVRFAAEGERRLQEQSRQLNANYKGRSLSFQCQSDLSKRVISLSVRKGVDEPSSTERPGGRQEASGRQLQIASPAWAGSRMQATWRVHKATDSEGYSDLLDNGAIRRTRLTQWVLEATLPLPGPGLQLVIEHQATKQTSNLPLFGFDARSTYLGLLYRW
jgi:hypothetical protein